MKATLPRRRRRPIGTDDYLDFARRIITAAGDRVASEDPEQFRRLIDLRADLDEAILEAVRGLRDHYTWEDIGNATGTTRQAAIMKWAPKL